MVSYIGGMSNSKMCGGEERAENLHYFEETPLHPPKIEDWCAISRRRLFGPIFFEESITAATSQNTLQEFIDHIDSEKLRNGYFQHDGATAHRSPDLTPLDSFLFLVLTITIFKQSLDRTEDLQVRIIQECESVSPEVLTEYLRI